MTTSVDYQGAPTPLFVLFLRTSDRERKTRLAYATCRKKNFLRSFHTCANFRGKTQDKLASELGTTGASISRWESGKALPRVEMAEALDTKLSGQRKLFLAWRVRTSRSGLPPWQQDVGRLQEQAVAIDSLSPVLVPGLLQCEPYAQIVFKDGQPLVPDSEIAKWVEARCRRLKLLRERHHGPVVTAVFPHSSLTCVPDEVRKEQAGHLIRLLEEGRVEVHLLPPGVFMLGVTAPMHLFRLLDGSIAVASDHIAGNAILDTDSHPRMEGLVRKCLASALPARESRQLLSELEAS